MINPQLLRESQIKDFNSLSRIQILTFTHFSEYIDSTVFLLYVAVLLSLPQHHVIIFIPVSRVLRYFTVKQFNLQYFHYFHGKKNIF